MTTSVLFKKFGRCFFCCFFLCQFAVVAQNLSFTQPAILLPHAKTDKAVDITNFKGAYFVSWKAIGDGAVKYSYLGRQYDTTNIIDEMNISGEQTNFSPLLQAANNHLYIFWISKEGQLKYLVNNSDTGFDVKAVRTVTFTNSGKLARGISATFVAGKVVVASHDKGKNKMLYCLLQPGAEGVLADTQLLDISQGKSVDNPVVYGLDNSVARFFWRSNSEGGISYADYNVENANWTKSTSLDIVRTNILPGAFKFWEGQPCFYIWKGMKNDDRVFYATANEQGQPLRQTALPSFFSTNLPVAVSKIDDNNFMMAYTGLDNHLYLSNFSTYDPAAWMKQVLDPLNSKKTLKDIVIPGSHDAGMSVLSGVGGQQSGTINSCNTLTQKRSIEKQLNAGIRMFDLRAGSYQNQLYAKHCSSDCMADAIGGGYGEKIRDIAAGIRTFLLKNNQEIVLVTFSHFCEKETPVKQLKDSLIKYIGVELLYRQTSSAIGLVPVSQLAGKLVLSFETEDGTDKLFNNCAIAETSTAFINFRRAYAATNDLKKLLAVEQQFFNDIRPGVQQNDLIRLDWQLTQRMDEAPMVCNDFEDENLNPVVNGVMLLANVVRKHKSIIDHSMEGNKYLPVKITDWINDGTIQRRNKPNILYVDVAGGWITDFCVDLNKAALYN